MHVWKRNVSHLPSYRKTCRCWPAPHECVFHASRCVPLWCIKILFLFSQMFYLRWWEIGLLVPWFSASVIVRNEICYKIQYYRNGVLTHCDEKKRAAWKHASVWGSPLISTYTLLKKRKIRKRNNSDTLRQWHSQPRRGWNFTLLSDPGEGIFIQNIKYCNLSLPTCNKIKQIIYCFGGSMVWVRMDWAWLC